jgi:hypothetical protein
MDDLFETLQTKRIEEINFEKLNLENITKNFIKQRDLIYKKNESLKTEMETSKDTLEKINNNIETLKQSDIKSITQSYQDIINDKLLEIKNVNQEIIKETATTNLKNQEIKIKTEKLEKDKEKNKIKLHDAKHSKYFMRDRENNLLKKKEKLENRINFIDEKVKNLKGEISQGLLDNVNRRHQLIQEYIKQQDLKKKVQKSKINIEQKIHEDEEKISNFREIKNIEKEVLLEEYNTRINQEGIDIIDEMDKMEETLKIFDIETEKELYFLKNNVKSLNKKLKNMDNYLNININLNIEKIDNKSHINQIKELKREKEVIKRNMRNMDIDIEFLNNEYDSSMTKINDAIVNEDSKFLELRNKNEQEIFENDLILTNFIKAKKVEIKNIENYIESHKNLLEKEKNSYFSNLQKLEIQREHVSNIQLTFNSKIEENNTIVKNTTEFFVKKNKDIKKRILYLEQQHLELTIKENSLGK